MNAKILKTAWKNFVLILMLALSLILASGCSKRGGRTEGGQSSITIKGSDTMVHLVSNWAEAFMSQKSGVDVSVTGGGSGTGIAALLNGTTDICAASRKIKNKELELALQKNIHPREIAVAKDGIAVVVHPENPINELTLEQLGKIFTDPSVRWSDVGGLDDKILSDWNGLMIAAMARGYRILGNADHLDSAIAAATWLKLTPVAAATGVIWKR